MQAPTPTLDRATDASPSRDVLLDYAGRQLAAAFVVAAAAWLVHSGGLDRQTLPYLVMTGAIVPQALLAVAALLDDERCARLRSSARPAPVPALLALALGLTAAHGWRVDQPDVEVIAATLAAVGLGIAALPDHVHAPRRPRANHTP